MTYKEIEKIAIENGWTTTSEATLYRIEKEYGDSTTNYIVIGKFNRNVIFLKNERCNPGDLIVIKAAIKLAETPPEERIPKEDWQDVKDEIKEFIIDQFKEMWRDYNLWDCDAVEGRVAERMNDYIDMEIQSMLRKYDVKKIIIQEIINQINREVKR